MDEVADVKPAQTWVENAYPRRQRDINVGLLQRLLGDPILLRTAELDPEGLWTAAKFGTQGLWMWIKYSMLILVGLRYTPKKRTSTTRCSRPTQGSLAEAELAAPFAGCHSAET